MSVSLIARAVVLCAAKDLHSAVVLSVAKDLHLRFPAPGALA